MTAATCPAPGCARIVQAGWFTCNHHWYALSLSTRSALWRTADFPAGDPMRAAMIRRAFEEWAS